MPWLNEAVRLLEDGVADIATIEAACKETFGVGMGPFELMNVTGMPIALHAATTRWAESFGPFYAPADALRAPGRSPGRPWPLDGTPDASRIDAVAERMLGRRVPTSRRQLVDEGVGTIEDTDIGARVGLRWPRGPFELMNRHGAAARGRASSRTLTQRFGLAPALLSQQASADQPFAFRLVRSARIETASPR